MFGDQLVSQFLSLKVTVFSNEIIMALVVCFNFVLFKKWAGSIMLFACICFFWLQVGRLSEGVYVLCS